MNLSHSINSSSVSKISDITPGSNIHSVTSFANSAKRAHFMTIFASVSHISSSNRKTIPISISNSLPSISFQLGLKINEDNRMRMLVDTETAMNSGNKDCHL